MTRGEFIRRLRDDDAASLVSLRREALATDPLAFGASTEDDRGLSLELVRSALADRQEQAVFGYLEGDNLTGMVGLIRASKVKQRHTGSIWGMYVTPRARNKGVGRALLAAAVQHARGWGLDRLQLGVTETALSAKRLYEAAGFRSWGTRAARASLGGALRRRISSGSRTPRTREDGRQSSRGHRCRAHCASSG